MSGRRGARHEFHRQQWKRAAAGGRGLESSVRSAQGGNGAGRGVGRSHRRGLQVPRRHPGLPRLPAEAAAEPSEPAAGATELAAAARTIAKQAEQIGAPPEWVNDVKAAISEILASTGKQIEGLKSGNEDLDGALAQLNGLAGGFGQDRTGARRHGERPRQEVVGAGGGQAGPRRVLRGLDAEAKTSRSEMKALSKRLDAGSTW